MATKKQDKRLAKRITELENHIRRMVLYPKRNKKLIRAYQLRFRNEIESDRLIKLWEGKV